MLLNCFLYIGGTDYEGKGERKSTRMLSKA